MHRPPTPSESGSSSSLNDDESQEFPCGESPEVRKMESRCGIAAFTGSYEDLWTLSGPENLAPRFAHGAGMLLADYETDSCQPVEMVPTTPYMRESRPPNLEIGSFSLRIVFEAGRTGFETTKDFPITPGMLIAGRYRIIEYIDSATFSRTASCLDEVTQCQRCLKIIRNSKSMFDQSLDELKLLQLLNDAADPDEHYLLRLCDYFYYKEHMFIVTELLQENLFQCCKNYASSGVQNFFTLARLQCITRQVLTALQSLHSRGILHCDLKPENILVKSMEDFSVKVIDFGNSCYTTDNLSSYVQSRSYRSPEVLLGCKYGTGIDVWSLGAILPELATGRVLFENINSPSLLASITALCGPIPASVLHEGRNAAFFVSKHGAFKEHTERGAVVFYLPEERRYPSKSFGYEDADFVDFVSRCLTMDHTKRPGVEELLLHPFLQADYGPISCSNESLS